jgi:hypothetical protein
MVTPGLFGVLYEVDRVLPWLAVGAMALLGSLLIRPLERRLTTTPDRHLTVASHNT